MTYDTKPDLRNPDQTDDKAVQPVALYVWDSTGTKQFTPLTLANFSGGGGSTSGGTGTITVEPDTSSNREATQLQVLAAVQALAPLLGSTDGLEALATTNNTLLQKLSDYNDGVEGLLTTLGGNTDGLESLLSALGVKDDNVLSKLEAVRALLAGTLAISANSLPLPAGAATQTTLASVLTALQGTLSANVVNFPANQAISATALPLPTGAATDAKVEAVRTLLAGTLTTSITNFPATQAISAAALPLPTGAATDAKVEAVRALLAGTITVGGSVSVSNLPATQAISATALPLPAGAATQATLASVLTTAQTLATDTKLEAVRALLAAPLSVGNFPATQTVAGSVSVSNFPATQPVSATALPLPAGAATQATLASVLSALQGTLTVNTTGLATDAKVEAVRALLAGTLSASITNLPATQAISAASLPLPTGAATQATLASVLAALQGTLAVSANSLPLPAGAATQTTLASVLTALQGTLTVQRANQTTTANVLNIAANGTLSDSVNLTGRSLIRLMIGSSWTAADLTVQTSPDGTTWYDLYDEYGNAYTIKAAASRGVFIAPGPLLAVNYLRFRSGTPGSTVVQASATTITLQTVAL